MILPTIANQGGVEGRDLKGLAPMEIEVLQKRLCGGSGAAVSKSAPACPAPAIRGEEGVSCGDGTCGSVFVSPLVQFLMGSETCCHPFSPDPDGQRWLVLN